MAENNLKESVKYKFGENELDLQQYIQTLDSNVKAYMDALKWNEGQRKEFMNAYNQYYLGLKDQLANNTNRFSTNGFGTILDSNSKLSNTDNDGIDPSGSEYYYDNNGNRITTDDYNLLKDKKKLGYKTFAANRHVATYFDKIGRSLIGKNNPSTPSDNKFDITKHGFVPYWASVYNPAGGDFDGSAILELDPYDETTQKRGVSNRQNKFKSDLESYISQVGDLDFSSSPFKTKEGYIQFLNSLVPKVADGLNEQDLLDFGRAGITREFLQPFISTDKVVSKTPAEIATEKAKAEAAAKAATQEERDAAMRAFIAEQQSISNNHIGAFTEQNPVTVGRPYRMDWYQPDGSINWEMYMGTKPTNYNLEEDIKLLLETPTLWGNVTSYPVLKAAIDSGKAIPITSGSLTGFYYFPRANDKSTATVIVYNPTTNQMFETFIGNVPIWDNIMSDWKTRQGWIDPTNIYMRKEGGVIQKFQYGGINDWMDSQLRSNLEAKAKSNGNTVKEQEAADRYINRANESYTNPNAGWKAEETARLIGGVADIASLISAWVPGYGTAASLVTGLGSTGANLFADIKDEAVNGWDVWKNLGLNLGMDLAGLVPGGGAAGKGAKIIKNIVHLAPKMIAAIGTVRGLANAPVYIQSWEKMMSSDEKLTAQDWTNIMQSIQVVLGPAAAVGQYAKNKGYYGTDIAKAKAQAKIDQGSINSDKIAVDMIDKNGKKKTVMFEGDDVADIRAARESGDIKALEAATVGKFKDLDGYTLQTSDFGFRAPKLSWDPTKWSPVGGKEVTPDILIHDVTTRQGVDFARTRAYQDDIKTFDKPGQRWSDIDDAFVAQQLDPLKSRSDAYKRVLDAKKNKVADIDAKLAQNDVDLTTAKISGKTASQLDADIKAIQKAKSDGTYAQRQNQLTSEQTVLSTKEAKLQSLENKIKRLEKQEAVAANETTRSALRDQIKDARNDRDLLTNEIKQHKTNIDDHVKWLDDFNDSRIPALQAEHSSVKALEDAATALRQEKANWDKYSETGHTDKYNDFISKYPVDANGNVTLKDPSTGREITRNLQQILNAAGIKYQKGGSFEKVRKFYTGGRSIYTDLKYLNYPNLETNASDVSKWNNWYKLDEIYNSYLKDLESVDANTWISTMNNLQNNYSNLSWNPQLNAKGYKSWNEEFDKLGLNKYFGLDNNKFDYLGPSTWGRNTFLLHLKNKILSNSDNSLLRVGNKNVKYINGNWEIDSDFVESETPIETPVETPVENPTETSVIEPEPEENKPEKTKKKFGLDTLDYRLPRALYADWTNKKITELAKKGEKPFLQDPMLLDRTVHSDLDAEMQGLRAAGALSRSFDKPMTSDLGAYMSGKMEAAVRGQEFINQGKEKSNQVLRASQEQAWQQEKENAQNRHNVAMQNRLAMRQTEANKNKFDQAYENKKHEIWDTYLKELQFNHESKVKENQSLQDSLAQKDISNLVTANLGTKGYGEGEIDLESAKIYQDVKNGIRAASEVLLSADREKFLRAQQVASKLETDRYAEYKGLRRISAKEGTKIRLANIKTKQKNVDRFAKQIKSDLDRNEKALARLSKSVYSYIKSLMV